MERVGATAAVTLLGRVSGFLDVILANIAIASWPSIVPTGQSAEVRAGYVALYRNVPETNTLGAAARTLK